MLSPHVIVDMLKGKSKAEGARCVLEFFRRGLSEKKFTAENISYKGLGIALGVIDPFDEAKSYRRMVWESRDSENYSAEDFLQESNPGVGTNAFQVITSLLIASKMIEGYDMDAGSYIGDELVTVMPGQRFRNQRLAGVTALAAAEEVAENMPYSESAFEEKYIITKESKRGRILSITEELLLLDQTGEINRRAMMIGESVRQERERIIVRGVIDADSSTNPVWRPSGTGTALYATDGSNRNYIGVGNTVSGSPYAAATVLSDYTDLDLVYKYRATQVVDDRVDGTPRPIPGLNSPDCVLLVPESLKVTGEIISNPTLINSGSDIQRTANAKALNAVASKVGKVLSSPFVDEASTADWYYGKPKKQFIWTEILPITISTQGRDSEASFERDVALRVKCRYWGGISAVDKLYVTKVDGA